MVFFLVAAAALYALALTLLLPWIYQRVSLRRINLPPGSLGWPFLGETLRLYTQSPNVFFASRHKRYGEIFKTHILGCPSVMIASPEAAKFILVTHAHLFKTTFPSSKEGIIGPHALFFHDGDYHRRLKRLMQSCFSPEAIRGLVPHIEAVSLAALDLWESSQHPIDTFHEMKKYAFDVGVHQIFGGQERGLDRGDLKRAYQALERGYNSFPIDIAGTPYNTAMKARKHLSTVVSQIIKDRRHRQEEARGHDGDLHYTDLLTRLMDSKDGMSDEQIGDNVIGVIFAAQDTTASVLTWLLKYLKENPVLLDAVTAEQERIRRSIIDGDRSLSWSDTRNMPLTSRAIQETLRLATILSFTFREAVEDVQYKDYIIPKGWKVMPLFRMLHHSPDFFPDPFKFDPSRFEEPIKPNTFIPFGNGLHSCPGNELAKLEILVLVHHLTTTYRWDFAGATEGVEYRPFPVPKAGLPITITRK
ncbi:hypothetical protein SELMODRAFT_96503 [Selaginella moellendorffii]|uniref:(+)-abscisic acid 8'-hydroxylase n=1 Tax=Selaginella moellendorffii TaxID=88036 RepID=D8RLS5_SELML|nr:abscisic acid 8'-hydroxylase 3 isoform X2 [Selaginella moellendorffii]EFJ26974.1 hypothetical protein SELMODRAFT_96503 [Selaginella moellendorffii]|eukprot:XP_002972057.1 abscisic acid 8'-hydroxylase 3 isoform X2 [Selaginella moellendorffii]